MKILCTICARGGSQGVKNKNIRPILGIPLIGYSIQTAKDSGVFSAISVSSDSHEILKIAKEFGADVLVDRPLELASNTSAKLPAIQHCFLETERVLGKKFDILVDLDCTSPLRIPEDITKGLSQLKEDLEATNLITGSLARRSPYFNLVKIKYGDKYVELASESNEDIVRRQDAPKCFDMNASFYIWRREKLLEASGVLGERTILYEMPEERSWDIDSEMDFEIVSYLMGKQQNVKR